MGRISFKDVFGSLKLNICEYTFEEHDEVVAYSLSIPFASTLVFGSIMQHQDAPGTTFKKHMAIARGLLSEDDYLLTEILFNPNTPRQLKKIIDELTYLSGIVNEKDSEKISIYNHEAGRIEDDEIYEDFFSFINNLYEFLGIGG